MELVASAKMRRAVQQVLGTRPYAERAWELLVRLAERTDRGLHPLLRRGQGQRIGVVLVTSNRGLVGGFNTQLVTAVVNAIRDRRSDSEVILLGRRGRTVVTKYGVSAHATFEKADIVTSSQEIRPLARLVIDEFRSGRYDRVVLAYTDYLSTVLQKPRIRQLLPLERDPSLGATSAEPASVAEANGFDLEYAFEPNADAVLETLLPRLVEVQLFQAVLESNASEHAARMMAMRNATDSAEELIDDLTLTYNQARQASITQDLAEISASRAALEDR